MDPEFSSLSNSFCQSHCQEFEESDENKLEYTNIHAEYCEVVETYIERKVSGLCGGDSCTVCFSH